MNVFVDVAAVVCTYASPRHSSLLISTSEPSIEPTSMEGIDMDSYVELLRGYNEGLRSVADVLQPAQTLQQRHRPGGQLAPHFLWSRISRPGGGGGDTGSVVHHWFQELSEAKLYELLRALMDVNPGITTVTDTCTGDSLLDVALGECNASPGCSGRVLRLLVHQEVTRARSLDHKRQRRHPLHMACYRRTMDPELIGRLVDLDPDVLTFRVPNTEEVPLHFALATNLTSISAAAAVQKMVVKRPDTLLCRDYRGQTPVEYALVRLPHNRPQHEHDPAAAPPEAAASDDDAAEKAAEASVLGGLVALRPGSVVPIGRTAFMDDRPDTALWMACAQYPDCPNLIGEIIRAYPPALCVASVTTRWNLEPSRLPLEAVATTTARPPQTRGAGVSPAPLDVEEETLHMALAVVEYVIGTTASSFQDPSAAGFRRHVADTVAAFFSSDDDDEADPMAGSASGFAVAKAVHRRVANAGRRRPVAADLLRALFCQGDVPRLLRGNDAVRDAVMGRTAIDLYRMNRRGRFDDDDPDTLSAAARLSAAHRHVDLVKLVSDNVECVYLHVREHWVYLLPQPPRQQA